MNGMQRAVDAVIQEHGQYWPVDTIIMRLAEEVGEVCKARRKESAFRLKSEAGDVLFTLVCLANSQGWDLDEMLEDRMRYAGEALEASKVDPTTGRRPGG